MEHHTIYGTIRSIDKCSTVTCSRQMFKQFVLVLDVKRNTRKIRVKSSVHLWKIFIFYIILCCFFDLLKTYIEKVEKES